MCGIVGIFPAGREPGPPDVADVRAMLRALHHRGPDQAAVRVLDRAVVGNSRLRILDLDPRADLPMASPDGQVVMAYNGEVTNFREIRRRFRLDDHHPFRTGSDTEVVLALYLAQGIDFLEHLTGHFAIVIVDQRLRRAWVIRDFFGIRPLFYAVHRNRLLVASEIKAFLELPDFPRRIDETGIWHYFTLAYIPGERTPFRDVRELRGSHLLEVDLDTGGFQEREYHRLVYRPDRAAREEDLVGPLREAMRDSVRRNLDSDAPVGLTFSGGFDTGSILALAREIRPASEIHTFSIVMEEPSFDESRWQRLLVDPAQHPHHEIRVGPREVEEALFESMAFLDEPSGDGAVIPFYLLAREASRHVRVLLSGEGGDETFNAYETHLANKMRRWYRRAVPAPLRSLVYRGAHALPCDYRKLSFDFLSKRFTEGAEMPVPEAHIHWRHVLPEEDKRALMPGCRDAEPTGRLFAREYDALPFEEELDRLSVLDIRYYFEADLMVKNDRMLMAHSIEARLPFMDRLLWEFMARVPASLRIRGLRRRYLQKQAMAPLVPKALYRRPNMGLEMPHSIWFLGPLRPLAERMLLGPAVERPGILDPLVVRRLWNEHVERRRDHGRALWCILELLAWFDLFVDSDRYREFLPGLRERRAE
ncbi:asparagine synthase (glutamine-hydrolyzing) [Myxococcota bacterium]|nr:asparagine synthase (glutamine-hydrolyzing) [Myxococcota bacterium]